MARTKRKINPVMPQALATAPQQRAFKVGAYIRLSIEDSGKSGANTIQTQRDLLLSYIEGQEDLRLVDVYCDNGRTGTNFDRPDFERMMKDVRTGRIDCIVVKDLSRFGRNYHETSNYLLRLFPFLGVRFIAVDDNFDTETAVQTEYGLIMPLKNIINDTYSRDISRKVSSAIATKERRGEFIGVFPPYGYSKSAEDCHKLVVNPETAPVIREIFSLRLQGMGYAGIAKLLNGRSVLSPGAYLYQCGLTSRKNYRSAVWATWNIKDILGNEVYLGHLVQGKRTQASYKQARAERYAPAEEWRICRNAHEAIIDEVSFAAAQEMAAESKRTYEATLGKADELKSPNLFCRMIHCADCGKAMTRRHIYSNWHEQKEYYYNYSCTTSIKILGGCTPKNLKERTLLAIVRDTIRSHLEAVAELERRIAEIWDGQTREKRTELDRRMCEEDRKLARNLTLLEGLYAQLVDGVITREEYFSLKTHYQAKYDEAKARYEALDIQKQELLRCSPSNPMFEVCRPFYDFHELSEDLVHTLISRIDVYDQNRLDIKLVYQDEFQTVAHYLEEVPSA